MKNCNLTQVTIRFIGLFFFTSFFTISSSFADTVWDFDINHLGPIRIGMTTKQVIKIAKESGFKFNGSDKKLSCASYVLSVKDTSVELLFLDNKVSSITFSSPTFRMNSGLGVGSTKGDVEQAFGKVKWVDNDGNLFFTEIKPNTSSLVNMMIWMTPGPLSPELTVRYIEIRNNILSEGCS